LVPVVIAQFAPISAACRIEVSEPDRRRIAVVGAGGIVDVAHLPAYRGLGLDVVGIMDLNGDRARTVATRHGIPRVYADLDELLDDGDVEVVDVAVDPHAQPEIIGRVISAGRHVLGQKPFAPSSAVALQLATQADANGVHLAVNQQLRFDEGVAAAHRMVELGWIGEVTAISFTIDIWTDWSTWPWLLGAPRLEVLNHSIHYHDAVRWFLGEPTVVFSVGGRRPGQQAVGETRTITTMSYTSGASSVVCSNHTNDQGDGVAAFRIDGSEGAIRGTLGLLYDYPRGRPDRLELYSRVLPTDGWVPYPVTTRWIPDAFGGPMAALLAAASGGPIHRSSARDNVGTLRVVEAIYASMDSLSSQSLPA
jgi:predicted dehydrogenase